MIITITITDFAHESRIIDRLTVDVKPLELAKTRLPGIFTLEVPPAHEERIRKALEDLRIEGLEFQCQPVKV